MNRCSIEIQQIDLESKLNSACAVDKGLVRVLQMVGLPEPRKREPGFVTLAEIINAQQLSTKAARGLVTLPEIRYYLHLWR